MTLRLRKIVINRVRHRGDRLDFATPHQVLSTTQALYFLALAEDADGVRVNLVNEELCLPNEEPVLGTYVHDSTLGPQLIFESWSVSSDVLLERIVVGFACDADARLMYGLPRVHINGVGHDIGPLVALRRSIE